MRDKFDEFVTGIKASPWQSLILLGIAIAAVSVILM